MISFLSCTLSLMAAASRLMYSYARDDMIFASHLLRHFDPKRHVPPYSMVIAASVPAIIVLGSMISTKALTSIVSFAILGIYLGFQMVVLAALRARLKGWVPSGTFTLGRWGMPVTIAALTYGVLTMINIAWPRTPDAAWYDNYLVALSAVVGVGIGAVYMVLAKPYLRSDARLRRRRTHPRRSQANEVQLRHAAGLPAQRVPGVDQEGRRARLLRRVRRRRDLAQGPLAAVRRGRAQTTNIRMGPSVSGVVLREPTPDRPGRGDARRADRRPRRGRALQRQLRPARAVQHRLGEDEAALPGQGGACR